MSASALVIAFPVVGAIAVALIAVIVIRRYHDARENGGATDRTSGRAVEAGVAVVSSNAGTHSEAHESNAIESEAEVGDEGETGPRSDEVKCSTVAAIVELPPDVQKSPLDSFSPCGMQYPQVVGEKAIPQVSGPPFGREEETDPSDEAIAIAHDSVAKSLTSSIVEIGTDSPAEDSESVDQGADEGGKALKAKAQAEAPEDIKAEGTAPEEPVSAIDSANDFSDPERPPSTRTRSPALHRDRRGARRTPTRRTDEVEDTGTASGPTLRQAEVKLRVAIDHMCKSVRLSIVLLRPEGFPETIDVDVAGFQSVDAFFEGGRYDDIDIEWMPEFLDSELRFMDSSKQLQWLRSARPIHIFAAAPEEPDLVLVSAARVGVEHAIICRLSDVNAVLRAASATGSPIPATIQGWEGIPEGWAVLTGYAPKHAIETPTDTRLRPLDPGADTAIRLDGGMEIASGTFAENDLPRIFVEPLPSGCLVSIGGRAASQLADSSWIAPEWNTPGDHVVDVVPGPSLTYRVLADPGDAGGWAAWNAHTDTISACGQVPWAQAAICGAQIYATEGRTVLASESYPSVVALGARAHVQPLYRRSDVPAAIGILPFEPVFLIVSSGPRRHQGSVVWLSRTSPSRPPRMRRIADMVWVTVVRTNSARRLPVLPNTDHAKSAWRSAAVAARCVRRRKT
jgi:hypothetical protein